MHLVPIFSYLLSPLLFHVSKPFTDHFPTLLHHAISSLAISDTHLGLTEIFAVPLFWPITELLDSGYRICFEGRVSKCLKCKHKATYIIVLKEVI